MRKQDFGRLHLEQLELRNVPNMILGQLGMTDMGSPAINLDNPASDIRSFVDFGNVMRSASEGQGDNRLFANAASSKSDGSMLLNIGAQESPNLIKMNGNQDQQPASGGPGDAVFDPLLENPFTFPFPMGNSSSLVLGGSNGGISLATGNPGSASTSAADLGSSAGNAGLAPGFVASAPGSFSLGTSSQSAPGNLLLSGDGHRVSPSQNGSRGPMGVPRSFGAGPNLVTGKVIVTAPSQVPVNADNDNGSLIVDVKKFPGIPTKRDFDVAPLKVNDPELLQGSVQLVGVPLDGIWSLSTPSTGKSKIALWIDPKKTALFTAANAPGTFYIEGVHESTTNGDYSTIQFTYIVNGTLYGGEAYLQVTPIIQTFRVSPAGAAGAQNIVFINGINGLKGLQANIPGVTPGATFVGSATYTNLNGNLAFIQDVEGITNGSNGTHLPNGTLIGYLYAANSNPQGVDYGLVGRQLPILDTTSAIVAPEYVLDHQTLQSDGNTYAIQDDDSPKAGQSTNATVLPPPGPGAGVTLDIYYSFTIWLVWKYPSGIYYPLAYIDWNIIWYAKANAQNPNGPLNNIIDKNGVFAGTYTASNKTPDDMGPDLANNFVGWSIPAGA